MRRHAARAAGTVLFLALAGGGAGANDTTAEIGAGGLVHARSDDVSMQSETLYLSLDRVAVDYVFRNHAAYDVETVVAFPMPDIHMDPYADIAVPRVDDNFLGFTVEADGQAIAPELQQRAYAKGVDVTDLLTGAGLPVSPLGYYNGDFDLGALPQETVAEFLERGLAISFHDADKGEYVPPVEPVWTLKSAYWWRMTFPAGKDVSVHHEYTPAVGGTVGVFFLEDEKLAADYEDRYCTDASFVRAVKKRQDAALARGDLGYTERWLSYVLTTGGNWAGSIGHFRLIIDKGSEKNLVSFCGEGVKKTGPTTFEMEKTDFWPERDLDLLFVTAVEP